MCWKPRIAHSSGCPGRGICIDGNPPVGVSQRFARAREDVPRGARATIGGPPAKAPAGNDERAPGVLQHKMEGAQKLAAGIPYNAAKALEYGDVSAQPPEGECATPDDARITASTLSESSASDKTGGDTPMPGVNRSTGGAKGLLEGAGVLATLPSGEEDPGVLIYENDEARGAIDQFVKAIAAHRHFARHSDPPVV